MDINTFDIAFDIMDILYEKLSCVENIQ